MLIMAFLALSIGFVQCIMDLLADILNALNEVVSPFSFGLNVSRIYPEWLQMVWPHQWGIMAEIPTLPERGCGMLSYGELCCSYVGHRGDFHPTCVDASSCTCAKCV